MPIERNRSLVEPEHDGLSVARQCDLLGMSRASYYYEPWEWDETALEVMRAIDEEYTLHPCKGKRRMCDHLLELGYDVGVRRTRTLMAWLGLEAIYPKKSLSTPNREHKKYPYLLKNLSIIRPNQVWASDITYVRLERGPVEFVITGDGDQRKQLEDLASSLGLHDSVRFLGFISNERLNDEYASCDIWVNPAIIDDRGDTEGLGIGAIEALMHRKAVVSCDVGGIPDVVQDGVTGLLVPQKDPERLAEALLKLLDHPSDAARMADTGFRFVQETFDWSRLTNRLEELYFQLLARRQGSDGSEEKIPQRVRVQTQHRRL
jgi:hypothetical protein